jgi:hypothetical protein
VIRCILFSLLLTPFPALYCFPAASIKLGAYAPVRDAIGAGGPDAPIYLKFLAGAMTGGVGSVFGNPFDVLKSKYFFILGC